MKGDLVPGQRKDVETTVCLFIWLCHAAYEILVPQPGIEPAPPEVEAWSLNHWTAREVPTGFL